VRDRGSPADARSQLTLHEPELARDVREAELEWRTAADVLLMNCSADVTDAAFRHIAVTDQKLDSAWQGRWHPDKDGEAYRGLNDAMRDDLL